MFDGMCSVSHSAGGTGGQLPPGRGACGRLPASSSRQAADDEHDSRAAAHVHEPGRTHAVCNNNNNNAACVVYMYTTTTLPSMYYYT